MNDTNYNLDDVIAAVNAYITHREVHGKGRKESISQAVLDAMEGQEARQRKQRALELQADKRERLGLYQAPT